MDSKGGANSSNGKSGDRAPRRRPPKAADHGGKRDAPVPGLPALQKDQTMTAVATGAGGGSSPCGACKFLRRKCTSECVFAPHFGSEQGPARFAAVHKVFGASNASKLLASVPSGWRSDAVVTVCYEAQARIADPVYGCVSTILALQQQVATLQAELSLVQSQLVNNRLAIANALRGSQQQQQQQQQQQLNVIAVHPEDYSNNSSASTNMINLSSFPSSLDIGDTDEPASSKGFEPFQLSQPSQNEEEDEI